jgi:hypothetical protein
VPPIFSGYTSVAESPDVASNSASHDNITGGFYFAVELNVSVIYVLRKIQIWRVATNILNKQSRTADRGGPPAWGLGEGRPTPYRTRYEMSHRSSVLNWVTISFSRRTLLHGDISWNI